MTVNRCPRCGHAQTAEFARCPACGSAVPEAATTRALDPDATVAGTEPGTGTAGSGLRTSGANPSAAREGERFAPGTILLERYRILGKIGAGGMGEVYRAEDLTLDQPVALKFLPVRMAGDEAWQRRFLQEVRLARQVAHPNVCRVYDVGETDGHMFLSMEYVEGRDLASVLRSIGRLPEEKGLDIARQLCAGLSALHDRGVLHRDLKPANVMLDDDGRVRITDFGLAGAAEQVPTDVRAGTPLYMAPEQLEGREVSSRSDIYALGLVLYEIFSGKRVFSAETVAEVVELHRSAAPSRLSTHVSDLDPAIERIVSRCLEKDPAQRPPSALVVATALPGGDPLAAALAMGETPSPELVAAAGGAGGIHPVLGVLLLALAVLGLAVQAGVGGPWNLVQYFHLDRSAGALEERARQLVADLGYDDRPTDRFASFARAGDILTWVSEQDSTKARWDRLAETRPQPLLFYYRQSPQYLLTRDSHETVSPEDPPPLLAGMLQVTLDANGRLVYFEAVPPERPAATADSVRAPEAAWDRLFAAADLNRAEFVPEEPDWLPDVYASERRAWRGSLATAGRTVDVVIEAGAVGPRPVYFRLHGPWTGDGRTVTDTPRASGPEVLIVLLVVAVLATGVTLALRHHRRRRTDVRGAGRLAAVLLLMPVVRWLFGLHHAPLPDALMDRFFSSLAMGALYALICLVLYFALEPFARRIWPQALIGWTRLLNGSWRDPMVGRSLLLGGAMFGVTSLLDPLRAIIRTLVGFPPPMPSGVDWVALAAPRVLIADVALLLPNSLFNALFFLMLLVLVRLSVRRPWLSYVGFLLIASLIIGVGMPRWEQAVVLGPLLGAIWTVTLVRGGLLAFVFGFYLTQLIGQAPLTLDFGQFHAGPSLMLMAGIVLVLVLALGAALGGRSLIRDD